MSIPLMVQDEVVGVLTVQSYRPNLYSEDDVRVLSIVASQGAAIYKELEALAALTSYTDNILSSIAAGVITLDSNGVILTWNKAAEGIIGLQRMDVEGFLFEQVISGLKISDDDKQLTLGIIEQVFQTGETYQGYKLAFHPVGSDVMYLNMSVSQLKNSAGERLGLVIIFEDVTKEIKMEDEFRRMGELAAVGQLAASIAHELRNPLSSIKGAAQLLKEQYDDPAMIVEFLEIIIDEVNGLSRLTTEFLDFARPLQLELKPTDLNELLLRILQLMSVPISQAGVEVVQRLCPTLPKIEADNKQIEQVLKNIVLNALQAMPEGGKLYIETRERNGSGNWVEMSISDTGMGILQDKLEKIFVPFFTTKTKGTGLGLSVVRKIVENHRGKIEVNSTPNEGTTFRVVLPIGGVSPLPVITAPTDELERRVSAELRPPAIE
jgi:two-component system sensor histidine kinase AtoS